MLARRGATSDYQRARQLLADALNTAKELGMNQLYDEVIAARGGLLEAVQHLCGSDIGGAGLVYQTRTWVHPMTVISASGRG
jgi:hypothetical protein